MRLAERLPLHLVDGRGFYMHSASDWLPRGYPETPLVTTRLPVPPPKEDENVSSLTGAKPPTLASVDIKPLDFTPILNKFATMSQHSTECMQSQLTVAQRSDDIVGESAASSLQPTRRIPI